MHGMKLRELLRARRQRKAAKAYEREQARRLSESEEQARDRLTDAARSRSGGMPG